VATVCSIVWASAPVYVPITDTTGGVISGYWVTGRFRIDKTPTNTIIMEITIEVTGLLMNTSEIMIFLKY
jgi:hypothetical protein